MLRVPASSPPGSRGSSRTAGPREDTAVRASIRTLVARTTRIPARTPVGAGYDSGLAVFVPTLAIERAGPSTSSRWWVSFVRCDGVAGYGTMSALRLLSPLNRFPPPKEPRLHQQQPPATPTGVSSSSDVARTTDDPWVSDQVWISGGVFAMGSDDHYPEEAPVLRVAVDGFWIDRGPVTNASFAAFVPRLATSRSPNAGSIRPIFPERPRRTCSPDRWCSPAPRSGRSAAPVSMVAWTPGAGGVTRRAGQHHRRSR